MQNYILKIIFKKNKMFPTNQLYNEIILSIRSSFILDVCSYMYPNPTVDHSYATRLNVERIPQIPNTTNSENHT